MRTLVTLMQREWLQHRMAWSLIMGLPLVLGLLLVAFGNVEFNEPPDEMSEHLPVLMALAAIAATTGLMLLLVWTTSLFMATGLPRRDHADRSIEFWMSMPVGHAPSLGVPLLVHLLLAPAAAIAVGLLGGHLVSLVLVGRFSGVGAWFNLPWGDMLAATLSIAARLLAGLPLATLWLAPLIGLALLCKALAGRWGLPVLVVGLTLGSLLLERLFGQPLMAQTLGTIGVSAAQALAGAGGQGMVFQGSGEDALAALGAVPSWALSDLGAALQALASPVMVFGLALASGCFAALVVWRQRRGGVGG